MATEFGEVTSESLIGDLENGFGDWMYYRSRPHGWIIVSQIGKANSRKHALIDKGWEPLDEYGRFDLNPYYADHPHEVLFARGGAKEMPVDQVVSLGYSHTPPVVPRCKAQLGVEHKERTRRTAHGPLCWKGAQPAEFPQVDDAHRVRPEMCGYCFRDDFPTNAARTKHIGVMHRDEMLAAANAREIGQNIQAALGKAAAPPVVPGIGKFACGECGEPFDAIDALSRHANLHEEEASAAAEVRRGPGRPRKEELVTAGS